MSWVKGVVMAPKELFLVQLVEQFLEVEFEDFILLILTYVPYANMVGNTFRFTKPQHKVVYRTESIICLSLMHKGQLDTYINNGNMGYRIDQECNRGAHKHLPEAVRLRHGKMVITHEPVVIVHQLVT